MAITLFEKKKDQTTQLSRKEVIENLSKAWNKRDDSEIEKIRKRYSGNDFEEIFRKVLTNDGIRTYGIDVEHHLIEGRTSFGATTNLYQVSLDRFHVFASVLYMIDNKLFLPESILDERLMLEFNKACDALGYKDLYPLKKDGDTTIITEKECYNPKHSNLDDIHNKELYKQQLQDIANYKSKSGGVIIEESSVLEPAIVEPEKKDPRNSEDKQDVTVVNPQPQTNSQPTQQKDPRNSEDKQEVTVVNPQPQTNSQPTQQVVFTPTEAAPEVVNQTSAKNENEVDIDAIFSSLISDDQLKKIETTFEKIGEDKAKEILTSEQFKNGIKTLIDMVINTNVSDQKEGVSTKKDPRA